MSAFIKQVLYNITIIIAKIHDYIMSLNNNLATPFTDKELHFIVMGTLGMFMVLITYPLFKYLSKKNIMSITFLYVLTFMLMLIFSIEIGQQVTNTGLLDFEDIIFGISGFIIFFLIFIGAKTIYLIIKKKMKK